MKKEQIQEIISLSSLIMTDPEYTFFINYIQNDDLTSARLFLDNMMSNLHAQLEENTNIDEIIVHYERCNQLEDLVLDLILGDSLKNDKRKPARRRIIVTQ